MTLFGLLAFAAAVFVTAAPPGAIVTAIVTRVLANGWRDGALFAAAIWLGDTIWLWCALAGLTALAQTHEWVFTVLKAAGFAYLLWLAFSMWHRTVTLDAPKTSAPLVTFTGGLALALSSPEIIVFYLAIVPNVVDLSAVASTDWVALTVTLVATLALIDCTYMALAGRLRRLIVRSPQTLIRINRFGALIMLAVAIYVVLA